MGDMDSYFAIIDELIEDENKVVTYKMLSHHLALPVNKSKEILDYYKNNSGSSKLYAVYSIVGKYKGKIVVCVVPDSKLDWTKSRYDSVMSCHLYSIQKADLKDASVLYGVDYEMTKNALYKCASFSMIKYNGSTQLTDEEIQNLRHPSGSNGIKQNQEPTKPLITSAATEGKSSSKHTNSFFSQKPLHKKANDSATSRTSANQTESTADSTSNNKTTNQKTPKTQTTGMKMFMTKAYDSPTSQASAKQSESSAGSTTNNKTTNQKTTKLTGMKMFMTKGKNDLFESSKNKTPSSVNVDKSKSNFPHDQSVDISLNDSELLALSEKMEIDDFDSSTIGTATSTANEVSLDPNEKADNVNADAVKNEQEPQKYSQKETKTSQIKSQKPKSLSRKHSNGQNSHKISKRRKRIKEVFSSSSSESEEEFMEDNNVIPPSPPPPPKAATLAPMNPRKKRVLKSRTYMDDEGAMLTERVYEEVSCSSEEEKEDTKQTNESKPPAVDEKLSLKQPLSGKRKQATLFGFFNKKQ